MDDNTSLIYGAKLIGGATGSSIAISIVKPQSTADCLARMFAGIGSAFLWTGYLIDYFRIPVIVENKINYDAIIAVAGLIGLISWFLLGALFTLLDRVRQSQNPIKEILEIKNDLSLTKEKKDGHN